MSDSYKHTRTWRRDVRTFRPLPHTTGYHFLHSTSPYFENAKDFSIIKVKVGWSRYRAVVAQRVGRGIDILYHNRGTRRGWAVSSTPRLHFTPGKNQVHIVQEAGWAPGPVWTGGKSRPHQDSIPDRPARSQSLYRLSYPAHDFCIILALIYNTIRSKIANDISVRMAWISFGASLCRKKETWWQLASRCCWNRARSWLAFELVSFLVRVRTY